ncbi:MAG: sulfatase [Verrucomicrobiaceae bacterium]|nr:sulfatase [Verrucomicrobiaceae bacterium]
MKRVLVLFLSFVLLSFAKAAEKPRLNIVFILIDDMGWTDLGCYGSDYYETPNVDRLARQGMKFTDAYAAGCVCSPTRVSILTGKYPARLHITHAIPIQGAERIKQPLPLIEAIYRKNLPLEEVTIAEALKDGGYVSATMGKWHVCWEKEFYPQAQGFDINVGGNNMGNPGNYFFPYNGAWRMTKKHPLTRWNTLPDGQKGEYLTDRLTDEALAFMDRHKERPFFLYLSHYAVHTPLQAHKKKTEKYRKKAAGKHHNNPVYAAMVESVDESVGRIMLKLDKLGIADKTVVIFTSDNGGHGRITSHHPLRGNKGNFYEGGIRVPLIVRWPGVVKPGSQCKVPVISTDFFPTILEIADLQPRPECHVDGVNIVSLLKGEDRLKRDALYWHYPNYIGAGHPGGARPCSVVRKGKWKLIESLEDNRLELFNLREDLGEKNDLAAIMPEKAGWLKKHLDDWRKVAGVQMPRINPDFKPSKNE